MFADIAMNGAKIIRQITDMSIFLSGRPTIISCQRIMKIVCLLYIKDTVRCIKATILNNVALTCFESLSKVIGSFLLLTNFKEFTIHVN